MTYSRQDIFRRIKATLPVRWFGENTPVLDLILNTLSAGWVGVFVLLDYVGIQTRAATAVDQWLDLVARDFFDQRLLRRSQETDGPFRRRILAELIRDRCTRSAIYDLLLDVTGKPPVIFEPTNPQDTGCYSTLGITE